MNKKNTLKQFSLTFTNISSIDTDGDPVMAGKKEGLKRLIEDATITTSISRLMKYHCIRHQENLCAKALKLDNVMQIIIKAVNFMKSEGLNHHQFQELLKTPDADYGDIIYFSEGSWLN